jgi:hypothetical protein
VGEQATRGQAGQMMLALHCLVLSALVLGAAGGASALIVMDMKEVPVSTPRSTSPRYVVLAA